MDSVHGEMIRTARCRGAGSTFNHLIGAALAVGRIAIAFCVPSSIVRVRTQVLHVHGFLGNPPNII